MVAEKNFWSFAAAERGVNVSKGSKENKRIRGKNKEIGLVIGSPSSDSNWILTH